MEFFAHRGVHCKGGATENSQEAILAAIQENVYGIEIDVQMTLDHELVIFHDYDLLKVFGINKNVADVNLAEIKDINHAHNHKMGTIITLSECLALIPTSICLNIELKSNRVYNLEVLAKLVYEDVRKYPQLAIILSSFNWLVLQKLRRLDQNLIIAILIGAKIPLIRVLLTILRINPQAVHVSKLLLTSSAYMRQQLDTLAIPIRVYTINSLNDYAHIKRYNVSGVFSNILLKL
jgi:glycerophosphoryl diester phosphodiesterase